jgi:DNA-binding Xre family transcriptional regulator
MGKCTKLKLFLVKNKISQNKLAKETGLHKNTVSKLMRTGEATKSVKELTRLYLQLERNDFNELLELE